MRSPLSLTLLDCAHSLNIEFYDTLPVAHLRVLVLHTSNSPIGSELRVQLPRPPTRINLVGFLSLCRSACLFISLPFSQLQETHGRVISLLTNYWECTVAREKDEAEGELAELKERMAFVDVESRGAWSSKRQIRKR